MIRCVSCGSSRFDPQKMECVFCGGSTADRDERCHVNERTRATVLQHTDRLKKHDVTVAQRDSGLVLDFDEPLSLTSLRKVVLLLWDNSTPKEQILRLRLDEPEEISKIIRDGIYSLRHGRGKLTQAFGSYVRHLLLLKRGDMSQRAGARDALKNDFNALIDAMMDDANWDETDGRIYEIMCRYEDQELPV